MEREQYEKLRKLYEDLTDEVLLEYLVEDGGEFTGEALELIRDELTRRGYSRDDLRARREEYERGSSETEMVEADVTPIARFGDVQAAEQARGLLEREGIAAFTKGIEFGIWGYGVQSPYGLEVVLFVSSHVAEEALALLESFPPVAEAILGPDEEGDH